MLGLPRLGKLQDGVLLALQAVWKQPEKSIDFRTSYRQNLLFLTRGSMLDPACPATWRNLVSWIQPHHL